MGAKRLLDALADSKTRVERRVGVLENHLDTSPPAEKLVALECGDINGIEQDAARTGSIEAQECSS